MAERHPSAQDPWTARLTVAALWSWLFGTLAMAVGAFSFFGPSGQDFRSFYAAGRLWLTTGGDPYDFTQLAPVLEQFTGGVGNFALYSPPWFVVPVAPLGLLPFGVARLLWLTLSVAFWLAALPLASAALDGRLRPWRRYLAFLAATFLLAWFTWRFEQVGTFLFLALAIALQAERRGRERLGGAAIALLLIKPTIGLAPVVAVALNALVRRRRGWLEGLVGGGVLLLLLSLPLLPSWLDHLRDPAFTQGLTLELDGPGRVVATRINTTLADWLGGLGLGADAIAMARLTAGLTGSLLLLYQSVVERRVARLLSVATLVGLWLVPYALQYDYPLLALPLLVALDRLGGRARAAHAGAAIVLAATLTVPFWEGPISDGFWILIGVSLLYGIAALADRDSIPQGAGRRQ